MTFVDPIGDMLTRIRNGQMRSLNKISIPFSVFRSQILEVLKKEGYIINTEHITNKFGTSYGKYSLNTKDNLNTHLEIGFKHKDIKFSIRTIVLCCNTYRTNTAARQKPFRMWLIYFTYFNKSTMIK